LTLAPQRGEPTYFYSPNHTQPPPVVYIEERRTGGENLLGSIIVGICSVMAATIPIYFGNHSSTFIDKTVAPFERTVPERHQTIIVPPPHSPPTIQRDYAQPLEGDYSQSLGTNDFEAYGRSRSDGRGGLGSTSWQRDQLGSTDWSGAR
jgi:hypothetical protein